LDAEKRLPFLVGVPVVPEMGWQRGRGQKMPMRSKNKIPNAGKEKAGEGTLAIEKKDNNKGTDAGNGAKRGGVRCARRTALN